MDLSAVYDTIYRRTATRARILRQPDIGATVDDLYALEPIVKDAAIEVARDTGRLEAVVEVDLVADQSAYTLTRGVLGIRLIEAGGKTLKHIDGTEARMRAEHPEDDDAGEPEVFGILQNKIILAPVPSAEYIAGEGQDTMTAYYLMASAVTSPDDWPAGSASEESPTDDLVSWLPVELEQALIHKALAGWYRDIGAYDDMATMIDLYTNEIRRHRTSYDPRRASTASTKPRYF